MSGIPYNMQANKKNNKPSPAKNGGGGLKLQVKAKPIARSVRVVPATPVQKTVGRVTTITGHEKIADVAGSVAFAATKYSINPGLPIFPWLSGRANGYEKHRFRKFDVCYVPSQAVVTTAGSVYLAADYDPEDAAPSSLADLSTYETQDNERVYEPLMLKVSPVRMYDGVQKKKMRCGPVAGDLQLYDPCSIIVATIDCANTNAIGQLWAYYEVDLISPQIDSTPSTNKCVAYGLSGSQTCATGVAEPIEWSDSAKLVSGFAVSNSSGALTLPCGAYKCQMFARANDSASETFAQSYAAKKNGSALTPAAAAGCTTAAVASGGAVVPLIFYFVSDGSDVLTIEATLTGAAGTLILSASGTYLWIEAI